MLCDRLILSYAQQQNPSRRSEGFSFVGPDFSEVHRCVCFVRIHLRRNTQSPRTGWREWRTSPAGDYARSDFANCFRADATLQLHASSSGCRDKTVSGFKRLHQPVMFYARRGARSVQHCSAVLGRFGISGERLACRMAIPLTIFPSSRGLPSFARLGSKSFTLLACSARHLRYWRLQANENGLAP